MITATFTKASASNWLITAGALAGAGIVGIVVAVPDRRIGASMLGLIAALLAFIWWRQSAYLVFVILVCEGFVRNWFDDPQVLLVKDALIAMLYVRVFGGRLMRGERLLAQTPILPPLAIFGALVLLQTLNPGVQSPAEALVGIRTWLFYVPLYFVAIELIRTERDIHRFANFLLIIAIPVCSLAILQFILGPATYRALGPGFAQATFVTQLEVGGQFVYRPNATFSFPSHFAIFLALVTLICLWKTIETDGKGRLFWMPILGLALGVNLIESQRTLLLLLPAVMGLILLWRQRAPLGIALGLAGGVAVIFAIFITSSQTGQYVVLDRVVAAFTNQGGIVNVRGQSYIGQTIETLIQYPFGAGTGATSLGSRYVAGGGVPLFVEFSFAKVIGDLGILGLIAYSWLFATLVGSTVSAERRANALHQHSRATLFAIIAAYELLICFTGYDLAVAATTLWFWAGAVQGLALADDSARNEQVAAQPIARPIPSQTS